MGNFIDPHIPKLEEFWKGTTVNQVESNLIEWAVNEWQGNMD